MANSYKKNTMKPNHRQIAKDLTKFNDLVDQYPGIFMAGIVLFSVIFGLVSKALFS